MTTRLFGERVRRKEDPRLLAGKGTYVDDVQLPGMVHAAVLRSPHAHARILRIDVRPALQIPGVLAVLTHSDLPPRLQEPLPRLIPHPTLVHHRTQYALAPGIARHVGEPVAFVVADNRYVAEDAAEQIEVDYEELPAVADLEEAAADRPALVHPDAGTNTAAHYTQRVGDYEAARADARVVVAQRFVMDRGTAAPLECRGVVAHWDARARQLTVWDSTQAPIRVRDYLVQLFDMARKDVRVIAQDVGGGFGPKIMMCYPEEILVPLAAMGLGRPVKWIEDRREHFFATNHERMQIHDAEIALSSDGHILGVRTVFLHDAGAYIPYGLIVPIVAE